MTYLSPTSLSLWEENRDNFYMEYLCESRKKRMPQTAPMAVGSAFDAYVKSFLHTQLIGKDPKFSRETLFEAQVEPHNRDEAKVAGQIVYDHYLKHGGIVDILTDLKGCLGKPRFETTVEGYVDCVSVQIGAVPFLGKPDIYFLTENNVRVIFDWKVTGYYSARNISPKRGYIRCLPKREAHKDAFPMMHHGYKINVKETLDKIDKKWANQLSIYAWLLGNEVGSKYVVAIDEVCCTRNALEHRDIRVAQHRALVSEEFQFDLFRRAHVAWYSIQSGHVFDYLSEEQSKQRCLTLDARMEMENGPKSSDHELFTSMIS